MISAASLASAFSRNCEIIRMQGEGFSHLDSLRQLPFRANCMNWVVGHVVSNRMNIFKLLKAIHLVDGQTFSRYERESDPILRDGPGVLLFEDLIHSLEKSQKELDDILEMQTSDELQRMEMIFGSRAMSVADWLFFFYFHETYHVGQTEILRQAAGMNDKVT